MKDILLFGPLSNNAKPLNTGGTIELFKLLVLELDKNNNVTYTIIDSSKINYTNSIVAMISIVLSFLKNIRRHKHISLHVTENSLLIFGPVVIIIAKLFNRTISMRKFAGNFDNVYREASYFKRFLIKFVLTNTNVNFFETKYLVKYFSKFNKNTFWFPNVRMGNNIATLPRKYQKQFVYFGTINKQKGIDEIIAISSLLSNEYCLDIYGPILEDRYHNIFTKQNIINYKGVIPPKDVLKVMNKYDVLLLPSYREGYPGVIIEAFSLGIPTIATRLEGIMEMINHKENGLLVDVANQKQLIETIINLDKKLYSKLSINAMISFSEYNCKFQTDIFLQKIGIDV